MSRRRKPPPEARPWQPLRRCDRVPMSAEKQAYLREHHGIDDPESLASPELWKNDRYTVGVDRRDDGSVECLSIRRNDRKAAHDWRHFQRIKNELAGPEIEAIELYPAMSRLMDTSNQYWLWCAKPGVRLTIGMDKGAVADADDPVHQAIGSVQRELDDDWKPLAGLPQQQPVEEGWWSPNVKSGIVHDHTPGQPATMHRECEPVYTHRSAS